MLELLHLNEPDGLRRFRESCTTVTADSWNDFKGAAKGELKTRMMEEQDGLCVYCECLLDKLRPENTRIDHIFCRSQYPERTLDYTNLALSCSNNSCDLSKKDNILPILPEPGCNRYFRLVEGTGEIKPALNMTKEDKKKANQTISMLNLKCDVHNRARRKRYLHMKEVWELSKSRDDVFDLLVKFCESGPYRNYMKLLLFNNMESFGIINP